MKLSLHGYLSKRTTETIFFLVLGHLVIGVLSPATLGLLLERYLVIWKTLVQFLSKLMSPG
jgi:hypothetical protein